jgi:hypothetical protein
VIIVNIYIYKYIYTLHAYSLTKNKQNYKNVKCLLLGMSKFLEFNTQVLGTDTGTRIKNPDKIYHCTIHFFWVIGLQFLSGNNKNKVLFIHTTLHFM